MPDLDVSGRPVAPRSIDLARFFRPRSVAVVGASDTEGKPNTGVWRRLLAWSGEVGATVHPVNPNRDTVDGLPAYKSVLDIPGDIDVTVILVGNAEAALAEAIEKKSSFAVIFASGFAETGEDGKAAQQRLGEMVAASELHLLGPNTNLNAFETFRDDLAGPAIALDHPERAPGPSDLPRPGDRHRACRTGRRPATRSTSSSPTSPPGSPTSPRSV